MAGRYIEKNVERKLYAESMGRCMNPQCRRDLFLNGDISEKAHIVPFCETAENTFDNLILLCPNCHTDFDKNGAFSPDDMLKWKRIRKEEINRFFRIKFDTFDELQKAVVPLLLENRAIFENYYLHNQRALWDKSESKILVNNRKLKELFSANLSLFQSHREDCYSNLHYIQLFMVHVDEFELSRGDKEKNREVLFPPEIDSMFGIKPIEGKILPSVESLELLIQRLDENNLFRGVRLGIEHPFICMSTPEGVTSVFLDDTPKIRQLYYDYRCFRGANIRLDSLNYALRFIRLRNLTFQFTFDYNVHDIQVNGKNILFVYEYCLSKAELARIMPSSRTIIVNLHNWNGASCISKEAYNFADSLGVLLLTMDDFYGYINKLSASS